MQIECAVLGTPVIGRDMVHAQNELYPKITAKSGRDNMMRESIFKLEDPQFYESVSEYAKEAVHKYDWEHKYKELTTALEGTVNG